MWRKSFYKNFICQALILAVFLLISGCNKAPDSHADDIAFTDALGRKVTVQKKPERVVALLGSFADTWMLSGGELCGAAEDAWDDFDLDLDGAVNIGGAHSPSLEAVLSANPDLVIASAGTASHVDMCNVLEKSGITVIYFDVDNFDDYLQMLDICTDITGRKDLYAKNGTDIKAEIEEIKREVKNGNLPEDERKILLVRASSGSVKAKGSEGTILGEILCDMGLINIADSDKTLLETLSLESIIESDPYRIFAVTMGSNEEKAIENFKNMIWENPAWAGLSAVKENRVHVMDRKLYNIKPNKKWAEAYEKIGEILLEKQNN